MCPLCEYLTHSSSWLQYRLWTNWDHVLGDCNSIRYLGYIPKPQVGDICRRLRLRDARLHGPNHREYVNLRFIPCTCADKVTHFVPLLRACTQLSSSSSVQSRSRFTKGRYPETQASTRLLCSIRTRADRRDAAARPFPGSRAQRPGMPPKSIPEAARLDSKTETTRRRTSRWSLWTGVHPASRWLCHRTLQLTSPSMNSPTSYRHLSPTLRRLAIIS